MFISDFYTLAEPADITVLDTNNNFLEGIRQVKSTTDHAVVKSKVRRLVKKLSETKKFDGYDQDENENVFTFDRTRLRGLL